MSEGKIYSERLGAISDAKFEAVAERFGLGRFVSAASTTSGLFGQNVFVTTTEGEFVLRGAPHWVKGVDDTEYRREDRYQFTLEHWFAQQLHERTRVPVPWPIFHDESTDIFGWPYLVMPKMPGLCTNERTLFKTLEPDGRRAVAVALGENLAEMQRLTWPFAGAFSPVSIALEPFVRGAVGQIADNARSMIQSGRDRLTQEDITWIERAMDDAEGDAVPVYLHGDYQFGNLTLSNEGGRWHVSGLFDFHTSQFSDGAFDVVRIACAYLDTEPAMARVFREAYGKPLDARHMALYAVTERLTIWDYFTRPENRPEWFKAASFRDWAERYVDGILNLL